MPTESTLHSTETLAAKKVNLVKRNDNATLKELYLANFTKVKIYILNNNGDAQQAMDIFQEAFIAMWRNIKEDRFFAENDLALNAYLFRIAKNKWLDHLRSSNYKKTTVLNSEIESHETEPENHEERQQKINAVMAGVSQLGGQCQQLLKMFYFEKKSYRTIAEILNLDEASARNAKYRCLEKLRKIAQNNPQ